MQKNVYVKNITENITSKGIYCRGKPFLKNAVYRILKNEKYSDVYHYNDEVFKNIYPQIIPND